MPIAVAEGLQQRDRDCISTQNVGLMGASDPEQLAFAMLEGRVIITRDRDFLRLAAQDADHAGVIFWSQNTHFGQLIKDIDRLCFDHSADDLRGLVLYF
jgi:hypothetical protein